jgi:hypothetical protein
MCETYTFMEISMQRQPDDSEPLTDIEHDDVTPEALAFLRERAEPFLKDRTFRRISGSGTQDSLSSAGGIRFDVA